MPKYYEFKVCGYYLYFTAHCIVECMHAHASDRKLTEGGSAKLFVKSNGDTVVQNRRILSERELKKIHEFIKENYKVNSAGRRDWDFGDNADSLKKKSFAFV